MIVLQQMTSHKYNRLDDSHKYSRGIDLMIGIMNTAEVST